MCISVWWFVQATDHTIGIRVLLFFLSAAHRILIYIQIVRWSQQTQTAKSNILNLFPMFNPMAAIS